MLDGSYLYDATLLTVDAQKSVARIDGQCPSPEGPVKVTLWQGLAKGDKLETIVQKTTELGVYQICPIEMKRSVAKMDKPERAQKKQERYQRIALEAAKQSGRAHVPIVDTCATFDKAIKAIQTGDVHYDAIFVAWEEEQTLLFSKAITTKKECQNVLIVIGPEGGITSEEWEALHALGAQSVSLGKRILRTETAGLCALSVLWTALGEM